MRRLPYPVQAGALVVLLAGLSLLTPVGRLATQLPAQHARSLYRNLSRGASWDDRLLARIGRDYELVRRVRDATPPDAVILMTDPGAPSVADPKGLKHQDWATYFLYPRKILYLHQQDNPLFAAGTFLLVDSEAAISWVAPEMRPRYDPGTIGITAFDMSTYLSLVRAGRISPDHLPPREPVGKPQEPAP